MVLDGGLRGLSGLGTLGGLLLFGDPDVEVASKVATGMVAVMATGLLRRTAVKEGAPVYVIAAGGLAFLAWWGGTPARVSVGVLAGVVAAMVVTRNRPVHVTSTMTQVLRLPPDAAFDALMLPHPGVQDHVTFRDQARLPNGGNSYWLDVRKGSVQWSEHHVDTEWDPPHRGATQSTLYNHIDGELTATGTTSTQTTFAAVPRGTRVTMRREIRLDKGGLAWWLAHRTQQRRNHRRYARRAEALAKAAPSRATERVRDPEAGPYLRPDD